MSQLYTSLAAAALSLITEMGQSVTIRTVTTTTPVKNYRPVEATSDETAQAVREQIRSSEIDGTVIKAGDRRYLVAASGLSTAPDVGSRLVDGSDEMEIVSVEPVSPGGTAVVYTVICRKLGP